jgi:hypothetical protein
MNHKTIPFLLTALLVLLSLACGQGAPTAQPRSSTTPNTQATVNAAVAATAQAQSNVQATVVSAVTATVGALPPTATPIPTPDAYTLSEEELEAMINEAVNQAVAATTQATTATTQATADESLSSEEVDTVEVYVYGADQAIAYAEELLEVYYQVYGDLAIEVLDELSQLEQELAAMSTSIDSLNATLQEINAALQQGQELAQETIDQLAEAALVASETALEAVNRATLFLQQAQVGREDRLNQVMQIKPNNIPADLQSTIREAFSFVDQARGALGDNKLSRDELMQIAQLGANVGAGFQAHGGGKMQGLSGKLNEITHQLARGQLPSARRGLGDFETSLGTRPSGLSQPGGLPQPGGGQRPGGGLPNPQRP